MLSLTTTLANIFFHSRPRFRHLPACLPSPHDSRLISSKVPPYRVCAYDADGHHFRATPYNELRYPNPDMLMQERFLLEDVTLNDNVVRIRASNLVRSR